MRLFIFLCLLVSVTASPILRQQQTPPDVQPDAELLPSGPSPSPGVSPSNSPLASPVPVPTFVPPSLTPVPIPSPSVNPTAQTSPQPTAGATPPLASPTASPPTDGRPLPPGVVPGDTDGDGVPGDTDGDGVPDTDGVDTDGDGVPDDFDGDGLPDDQQEPEPTPVIEGGSSNRAALAGGLTGGIFALLLLLLCLYCFVFAGGKREEETATGVYTSTEAGVGPSAEGETSTEGAPSAPGAPGPLEKDTARDAGPAVAVGAGAAAAAAGAGGEGTGAVAPVPRGPTPPPHDYVLGAGPAATRRDFVDLRTKFERDEIGDNSAVLGMERSGVVGEGVDTDISKTAAATGATVGAAAAAAALPHETETALGVDIKPESLPDRGGPVPMTFESQERLMAGGDGSGAISDAAMSLNAASIVEESGDVPSLERDPIIRNRDERF